MIQILINNTDHTGQIDRDSLQIVQILGQRDTAQLEYRKYGSRSYIPQVFDVVVIYDGSTKIFGGRIAQIAETVLNDADGLIYTLQCVDFTIDLDSLLVSQTYTDMSVQDIIADFISNNAPDFTYVNVVASFVVPKIVFNQVPISQCLKQLADMLRYDWYVDPDKDIHFFSKYTNAAPYNLTDTSGNYLVDSFERDLDGTQIANQVIVRGGLYDGATYSDSITVSGDDSKTFILPYQFSNLTISLNSTSQTVGIDNVDTFSTKQVLYNYDQSIIKFENNLNNGDVIAYSGNPKVPVLAIASDANSITQYGIREKLIEDSSIVDINVGRQRAIAELLAYKDQQTGAKFDTYSPGLRTGMVINLASTRRASNVDFLVNSVTFTSRTPTTYAYSVELITTKTYDLIQILQSLLQPVNSQPDNNTVADTIRTDIGTITITETITRNSPGGTDIATITIAETIAKDPLGAGVEPDWVLAPYVPSGTTDTKREGLLDYSLKVY
jgi:hypothetical protein